jgi:hypothetical protein
MATTKDDLATKAELEALWDSPSAAPHARREPVPRPRRVSLSEAKWWRRVLLAAWLGLLVLATIVEPATNPNAIVPLWATAVSLVFMFGLLATMVGLGSAQPWGVKMSMATAVFAFGMAAACGVTGHHLGAWWAYEMGAAGGLIALNGVALRRTSQHL